MNEVDLETIAISLGDLVGKGLSAPTMMENACFVDESKRNASSHEWLYHCTNKNALISMIEKNEMWLSNLKLVNDQEEVDRIDLPAFEKRYFVACFTYDPEIPSEHWDEYGTRKNGVLWAVKKSFFKREVYLLDGDNKRMKGYIFHVFGDIRSAKKNKIKVQTTSHSIINPYYMDGFGFYQVIYNDELKKSILGKTILQLDSVGLHGRSLSPDVPGIVKATRGLCQRYGKESYEKDWTSEKEVRLKVSVQQLDNEKNGYPVHDGLISDSWFRKVAVPFSDTAFQSMRIRLSSDFENREQFLARLHELLPDAKIEEF